MAAHKQETLRAHALLTCYWETFFRWMPKRLLSNKRGLASLDSLPNHATCKWLTWNRFVTLRDIQSSCRELSTFACAWINHALVFNLWILICCALASHTCCPDPPYCNYHGLWTQRIAWLYLRLRHRKKTNSVWFTVMPCNHVYFLAIGFVLLPCEGSGKLNPIQ